MSSPEPKDAPLVAGRPVSRSVAASTREEFSDTRGATRFNTHASRVRAFARRAYSFIWIEPVAIAAAALIVGPLFWQGRVTSVLLALVLLYVIAQVLIAIFSLAVMAVSVFQTFRNRRGARAGQSQIRLTTTRRPPAASSTPSTSPEPTTDSDTDSFDTSDFASTDDADAAAAATTAAAASAEETDRSCRSACRRLPRPPQVVRWDIVGVTLSNWFGKVNSIPLPVCLRAPLYRLYAKQTGVNLAEVKDPLPSFRNLQEFFARELKPGLRPVADSDLVSPVDARIVVLGPVEGERVEQVKGVTYPLPSFLGEDTFETIADKQMFHCVLYLAPGDYHRIHSAADCSVTSLRHFPGTLFPISPVVARLVPNLFALNERVVLTGQWKHGFFSSTAVGAYHVGSIAFHFDKTVRTNRLRRDFRNPNLALLTTKSLGAYAYDFTYPPDSVVFSRGQEIGSFKLGSTIVLIFEVPRDHGFEFLVKPGEKVRMGQALGRAWRKGQEGPGAASVTDDTAEEGTEEKASR